MATTRRASRTGDGDICPVVPEHGHMLVLNGNRTQYCSHQSHDGAWRKEGKLPPSRNLWPFQYFAEAVRQWRIVGRTTGEVAQLPDLDIDLGGLL